MAVPGFPLPSAKYRQRRGSHFLRPGLPNSPFCPVRLHPPAPLAATVPRLLKPYRKADARGLRTAVHVHTRNDETLTRRVMHGKRTDGEERPMNTSTKTAIPMIEAKSAKGPPSSERPQERDPGEFLPWLPCTLALDLPVVKFTVGDLLSLTNGSIVETAYHQSSDLPLRVNGQLVGWTEFEVVGERLAVRLTDLS
jgi:flagellar motor switch/type III secretory pathway protein FliN